MDGFRVGRVDGLTGCIGKLRCGRDVRDVRILLLKQKGCGEYFPLLRILSIMSMGEKKKTRQVPRDEIFNMFVLSN